MATESSGKLNDPVDNRQRTKRSPLAFPRMLAKVTPINNHANIFARLDLFCQSGNPQLMGLS